MNFEGHGLATMLTHYNYLLVKTNVSHVKSTNSSLFKPSHIKNNQLCWITTTLNVQVIYYDKLDQSSPHEAYNPQLKGCNVNLYCHLIHKTFRYKRTDDSNIKRTLTKKVSKNNVPSIRSRPCMSSIVMLNTLPIGLGPRLPLCEEVD